MAHKNGSEREDELTGFWRIKLKDSRTIDNIYDDVVTVEIIRVAKRTPKTHTGLA